VKLDFDQAKQLLNRVVPVLKINTGKNVKTPGSYLRVIHYANSQGLYKDYFEKELNFNPANNDLSKEAKKVYHYDDKLASLYSGYRKLGFSDAEARFECNPKLSDWMKINCRRNIAAAVTVAPFLLWSVPYGLSRVIKAKNRNKALQETATPVTPRLSL
jgi:hypothetical protein